VRDTRTGLIRSVMHESYLLLAHEELWEMPLGDIVEDLIYPKNSRKEKYRVVTYKCPYNSAT